MFTADLHDAILEKILFILYNLYVLIIFRS